jgi:hypothetical protein
MDSSIPSSRTPYVSGTLSYQSTKVKGDRLHISSKGVRILSEKENMYQGRNVHMHHLGITHHVRASSSSSTSDSHISHSKRHVYFAVGTKVEYLSETLNDWIVSIVTAINPDGTYCLDTKRSATPSRVRRHTPSSTSFVSSIPYKSTSDLTHYRDEIFSLLKLRGVFSLVPMSGFSGGQNYGIYFIQTSSRGVKKYCLKVIKSKRIFDSVPSERENYIQTRSTFPNISTDPHVMFPTRIFQLANHSCAEFDIIVMPVARGSRMAETVASIIAQSDYIRLARVFRAVGRELKAFHDRYHTQHGDLQTSNIYVCEDSSFFVSFIDVGGMGARVHGRDVDYFRDSIRLLAKTYGSRFQETAIKAFNEGYGDNFS